MYALILYDEMKIDRFVDEKDEIPGVYFIDMSNHPQKDIVKEGWYYNPNDNLFSEKCPENLLEKLIQPIEPEPTQLDRIEETVTNTALTTEYMACLQEVNAE